MAGRPNVYESKVKPKLKIIAILKANGVSMEEIASMIGVTRATLYNHMDEIDELFDTIKNGGQVYVEKLEAKLQDLALGNVKTTKTKIVYDGDKIRSKEVTEDILAPNLGAIIFSLTNLAPDKWKNKQELNNIDTSEEQDKDMDEYEK